MKKIILNSFLVFLIIGCTSTTPIPTLIVNTSTPIPPTVLPTATLETSQDICNKVEQVDLSKVESHGKMIFTSLHYQGYIVNTNNFEKIKIDSEEDVLFSIAISPNRQLSAYQLYSRSSDNFNLIITRFDETPETIIPWEEEWSSITSWLDNQRLLINTYIEVEYGDIQAKEFSTFLVLNPFTNEHKVLEPIFPEIYSHHLFPYWGRFGSTLYSPNLDKVIYVKESDEGGYYYVLWSIEEQKKLADFQIILDQDIPQWAPSSEKFVMSPSLLVDNTNGKWPANNLYVVDSNGQSMKITNLSEYFTWIYIGRFLSWSPDERYIAFWFSGWNERPDSLTLIADQYLGIVEVETKNLKIYCLSGNTYPSGVVPPPVWSPDGTQIIVESPLSEEHSQVLLLDLEKEIVAKIGEDMIPVGWMIEP